MRSLWCRRMCESPSSIDEGKRLRRQALMCAFEKATASHAAGRQKGPPLRSGRAPVDSSEVQNPWVAVAHCTGPRRAREVAAAAATTAEPPGGGAPPPGPLPTNEKAASSGVRGA